jgi:hypothetical protein
MRYDRASQNLDRHPNHILAAFVASGVGFPSYRGGIALEEDGDG